MVTSKTFDNDLSTLFKTAILIVIRYRKKLYATGKIGVFQII